MPKGEIILIPFPFTDLTNTKIRPCLVLIEAEYDITVCFITTQTGKNDPASLNVSPSIENGLKKESLIRLNKMATIDKELVIGKIGVLNKNDLNAVNQKLITVFQLL